MHIIFLSLYCLILVIRESSDDGILTGLLFGPLIASALLYSVLQQTQVASSSPLPPSWRIEPPAHLSNSKSPLTAIEALLLSRYSLIDLSTLCSTILLFHVCASWWFEAHRCRHINAPSSERYSVPRSEVRRTSYYVLFTIGVSLGIPWLRALVSKAGWDLLQRTFASSQIIPVATDRGSLLQICTISKSSLAPCFSSSPFT